MQNVAFVVNVAPFVMFILFIIGCKCTKYYILFSQQSFYLYVSQKCKIHVILERGGKCIFVNLSGFSIKYLIQSNRNAVFCLPMSAYLFTLWDKM